MRRLRADPAKPAVFHLRVDTRNPGTLYAWTPAAGLFKSTDGADLWEPVTPGLPQDLQASSVIVDPRDCSVLYAGTSKGAGTGGGGLFSITVAQPER